MMHLWSAATGHRDSNWSKLASTRATLRAKCQPDSSTPRLPSYNHAFTRIARTPNLCAMMTMVRPRQLSLTPSAVLTPNALLTPKIGGRSWSNKLAMACFNADSPGHTTWFLRKAAASLLEHRFGLLYHSLCCCVLVCHGRGHRLFGNVISFW